jgi:hypothetical protein
LNSVTLPARGDDETNPTGIDPVRGLHLRLSGNRYRGGVDRSSAFVTYKWQIPDDAGYDVS